MDIGTRCGTKRVVFVGMFYQNLKFHKPNKIQKLKKSMFLTVKRFDNMAE